MENRELTADEVAEYLKANSLRAVQFLNPIKDAALKYYLGEYRTLTEALNAVVGRVR